jgi:hypothetical protein
MNNDAHEDCLETVVIELIPFGYDAILAARLSN